MSKSVQEALAEMDAIMGKCKPQGDDYSRGLRQGRMMTRVERCVCTFDEDGNGPIDPCAAHLEWAEQRVQAERERCSRVAKLHECYVRDYSRDLFARAIADKIASGDTPTEREVEFARSVGWEKE